MMTRVISTILLLSLTACGSDDSPGSSEDTVDRAPIKKITAESLGDEFIEVALHEITDSREVGAYVGFTDHDYIGSRVYRYKNARYVSLNSGEYPLQETADDAATALYAIDQYMAKQSHYFGFNSEFDATKRMNELSIPFQGEHYELNQFIGDNIIHDTVMLLEQNDSIFEGGILDEFIDLARTYMEENPHLNTFEAVSYAYSLHSSSFMALDVNEAEKSYAIANTIARFMNSDIDEYNAWFCTDYNGDKTDLCQGGYDDIKAAQYSADLNEFRNKEYAGYVLVYGEPNLCDTCGGALGGRGMMTQITLPNDLYRRDYYQASIIAHELVHAFDYNNRATAIRTFGFLPEGLAESFIASSGIGWSTLSNTPQAHIDEAFATDGGRNMLRYGLYTSMINYLLVADNLEESKIKHFRLIDWFKQMKQHDPEDHDAHLESFNQAQFVDHKGDILTHERYKADLTKLAGQLAGQANAAEFKTYVQRTYSQDFTR